MTSTIAAIIVGLIIWLLERMIGQKDKKDSVRGGNTRASRQTVVSAPPATPAPSGQPFLNADHEGVRVTTNEASMTDTPKPQFTKAQKELRRTIILGEILRRKF